MSHFAEPVKILELHYPMIQFLIITFNKIVPNNTFELVPR